MELKVSISFFIVSGVSSSKNPTNGIESYSLPVQHTASETLQNPTNGIERRCRWMLGYNDNEVLCRILQMELKVGQLPTMCPLSRIHQESYKWN